MVGSSLGFSILVAIMSRGQRLTFLGIAAVIAVVAVILLAGGGDETDKAAKSAQTPTPTATESATDGKETATPTPAATPKLPPLLQAGSVKTLIFNQGDTVRFRVRNDKAEEVHIHGYDIKKELEPNQTATISFKATITGIFEIELEGSATQIAELKVEP
jgi:FtsP/CotA-like multicopper oxidase with cupredoxin domain